MKRFELLYITGCPGNYTAHVYNRLGGYYKEIRFLWYSKKEMIYLLRNKYDCMVKRGF